MKTSMQALTNNCSLFSRLHIACQSRDGDLDNFFKHENQPWPPSLSKLGELRTGKKADLLDCLISKGTSTKDHSTPSAAAGGDRKAVFEYQDLEQTEADELGNDDSFPTADDLLTAIPDDLLDVVDILEGDTADVFPDTVSETDLEIASDANIVFLREATPSVDAKVFDGAAVVQMLPPKLSKTFQECLCSIHSPTTRNCFQN